MEPEQPLLEPPADNMQDAEPDVSVTDEPPNATLRSTVEWIAVIVVALVAALLIKAFIFQAFEIPTGSMETTVNIDDRILVNKLSYRFGEVDRGDLVVFRRLEGTVGTTDDLIKRVVALPGETIEVRDDGRIWIWGPGESADEALRVEEPYLDPQNAILQAPRANGSTTNDVWHENCVNQQLAGRCTLDSTSYFMMGDNRYGSSDSRFFGPIPEANLVGQAFARIWPLTDLGGL